MSKTYWLTPEEAIRKKQRKKFFIYSTIMLGTVILSALITILANKI